MIGLQILAGPTTNTRVILFYGIRNIATLRGVLLLMLNPDVIFTVTLSSGTRVPIYIPGEQPPVTYDMGLSLASSFTSLTLHRDISTRHLQHTAVQGPS